MDSQEVAVLKKALERQKKARKQAEKILEEKSKELYDVSKHLKDTNEKLENMLQEKTSELEGVFITIVDPYVVMDLQFNVLNMNESARAFLGFDNTKENINLSELIHKDYEEYTLQSIGSLMEVGILKNYKAKIITKNSEEKWVQINSSLIYDKERTPIAAQGIIRDISQETEIKQLLADQRKQLDIIVENSPLGIVLMNQGKIIKSNSSFAGLFGYSEAELRQLSKNDILVKQEGLNTFDLLEEIAQCDCDNFTIVKNYDRKDGSSLHAKTNVNTVKNNTGEIEFQVAVVEDISNQLKAEEKLKASENRLSTLILNLQTGVLLEDEHRKITLTNQLFCDLFQIQASPEQMIGVDCKDSAEQNKGNFKDSEKFVNRIKEILLHRKVVLGDELEMVDGRILERDYIPIFDNGYYKGHLWTYRDVTIRKNYRKNLEIQRAKYGSIIANMNLGLLEVDTNDIVQMVNQSFCKMSGFTESEIIGKKARKLLRVINTEVLEEKDRIRINGTSDSYEIEVHKKKGERRHWLISGAPRYDDNGNLIGSLGIHLDITDQKELELQKEHLLQELETSNKELQEYAHIVSHDLKSPLRSISALATWLNEDYEDLLDESGRFNLQQIQEKIEGMDRLINGILKYSSINGEGLTVSAIDVNSIVDEIRDIIFIPENVRVEIMNPLPVIRADKTKIHQLFQNIIGNAVVHIKKDEGLVAIRSTENRSHWQFSITDNGVGIAAEYHEKIFKIFQSIDEKESSTGIGLSIVKKIVDLYQGKVWLESAIGKGTTFHFTIKK